MSGVSQGGLAQLVEHLLCKQGVIGSNPIVSRGCLEAVVMGVLVVVEGLILLWSLPAGLAFATWKTLFAGWGWC